MIQVTHLTKRYGNHIALNDLSFHVNEGEIVGFLGPNGAGKSTTLNILSGYLSSTSGQVLINHIDLLAKPKEAKRHIGYLPEIPPLYGDMTIHEYLTFVARLKKVPSTTRHEHIKEIVQKVHLDSVYHRLIKNISKGYQQRVGLAAALISYPKVLLLDEPTVGLDPNQLIAMRTLIKSLSPRHTILLSSHILSEISAICDKVLIVNEGHAICFDTPSHLQHLLTISPRLILRLPIVPDSFLIALGSLSGVTKVSSLTSAEHQTIELAIESKPHVDIRESLFRFCSKNGYPILMMTEENLSLEDVFLQAIHTHSLSQSPDVQEAH